MTKGEEDMQKKLTVGELKASLKGPASILSQAMGSITVFMEN